MLKKIIIVAAVISLPIVFYTAFQTGQLDTALFSEAVTIASSNVEGDQAPKVIIVTTIVSGDGHDMVGKDASGAQFTIDYTGSEPDEPFAPEQVVRFVGHVHGGETPYFHATQVYAE